MVIGVLIFVFIYIILFPKFYSFADEDEYMYMSHLIKNGKSLKITEAFDSHDFNYNGEFYYPQYPIGNSLIVLPFTLFGWQGVFISGLIIHLLSFFVFVKILKRLGYEKYLGLLYLLFPGFVFFSRTIMSEMPSILFILLGFYFYLNDDDNVFRNYIYTGLFFGIAFLIRYPNILVFGSFAIIMFFKNRKKLYYMILGFLPCVVVVLCYNYLMFGNVLVTGYGSGDTIGRIMNLSLSHLVIFFKYILYMMILYPLMLVSPIFYKNKAKNEIRIVTFLYLLVFGVLLHWGPFHYGFLKNVVIGPRYFFPIIPFLIITSIDLYKKMFNWFRISKKFFHAIMYFVILLLIILCLYISSVQNKYTDDLYEIKDLIYENTEEGSLIYGSYFVSMFVDDVFGERGFIAAGYDDAKDELRLPFVENYIDNFDVNGIYVVFINRELQGIGENEVFIENQGETYITENYDTKVVYFTEEPQYLKIYKVVE